MAVVLIDTLDVNLKLGTTTEFPVIDVRNNRTTAFFIEALPSDTSIDTHYLLILGNVMTDNLFFELPLITKYYPKGKPMLFTVSIPNLSGGQNVELQINVVAVKRFIGSRPIREIVPFRLSWEDNRTTGVAGAPT